MLNAAILGFGGIARSHKKGYSILEKEGKAKLVAVCDIRPEAFEQKIEINMKSENAEAVNTFNCYTDLEEMLEKEQIDFIDICLPSFLHREYSVKLMEKGYNVLCEKPMALNSEDCEAMLAAEKKSGKHFMIAQVLRFFNEYEYLRTCIENNTFGKPLSAFFNRVSNPPIWGWENWFMDYGKAGGCITDLHIHDVDIVRYLFGEPKSVSCHAADACTKYDIVQTVFQYDDVLVTAHGAWATKQTQFSASYRVDFEKASVVYENGTVTVYPDDDTVPFTPDLAGWNGYTNEIAFFCDVVSGKTENKRNPASSAAKTIRLIETMKQSADGRGEIITFKN
jgi:predicted dehydrogenase